jgi:hypothetical protein
LDEITHKIRIKGEEVSVVYFRSGAFEADYPSDD